MRGIDGVPADTDRDNGFKRALAENPGITVVKETFTGWDPATGAQQINDIFASGMEFDGIWTSGIDIPIVEAFKTAEHDFVPIVGADNNEFVAYLDTEAANGLVGRGRDQPAAVGGAGVTLALKILGGEKPDRPLVTLTPEVWDNTTDAGKAKIKEAVDPELNAYYGGHVQRSPTWTTYSKADLIACKGPGELIPAPRDHRLWGGRPASPAFRAALDGHDMTDLCSRRRGVAKRYGAVTALRDASLAVRPGEVHALMGANGAGKSTLVKILTGAVRPDAGTSTFAASDAARPRPPRRGGAASSRVYQEPALIPDLDMLSNLRLTADADRAVPGVARGARDPGPGPRTTYIRDLPLPVLRIIDLARALAVEPSTAAARRDDRRAAGRPHRAGAGGRRPAASQRPVA